MKRDKLLWVALGVFVVGLRVAWMVFVPRLLQRAVLPVPAPARVDLTGWETVSTTAMSPTIRVGEYVKVEAKDATFGDIVQLTRPDNNDRTLLRIVGAAGDTVTIRDKRLFVNDTPLNEPYAVHDDPEILPKERDGHRDQFGPIQVPQGYYFVLGDNRDHASDSRYFGMLPEANVKGKVISIYSVNGGPRRPPAASRTPPAPLPR